MVGGIGDNASRNVAKMKADDKAAPSIRIVGGHVKRRFKERKRKL